MMPNSTRFVVLGRLAHHDAQQAVGIHLPYGVAASPCAPDEPWPEDIRARVLPIRGMKKLRGSTRLAKLDLLQPGSAHHWIVRRASAEAIAALGRPGEVRLVPSPLVDDDGLLDDDWALLDVRAVFPLDRDASKFTAMDGGAPHASLVVSVERVDWAAGRAPVAPLFRVAEAPELLCVREDVLDQVRGILGPWVVEQAAPYDAATHDGAPCAPLRGIGGLHRDSVRFPGPPLPIDEATGKAAYDAFYRLISDPTRTSDRRAACESPITAYFLARIVDGAPSDETRAGALLHPRYATLYARDVDREPRDDTRRVALRERYSAHAYLEQVERTPSAAFREVLGDANVAALMEESPSLRAASTPPPERFPASWSAAASAPARAPKPKRKK